MLIIGKKEEKENTVSLRRRKLGNIGTIKIRNFIKDVLKEIKSKEVLKDKE